jgi:hypothetical protein
MKRDNAPAIITAVAAVFAALAGSYVGSNLASSATRDVMRQQIAQEDLRVDAEARGAARILVAELYTAAKEMKDLGLERYFRPFNDEYRIDIAQPDPPNRIPTQQRTMD